MFKDKDWLLKSYRKHFERFRDDVYWKILNVLQDEKVFDLEREVFYRIYYSILPFRIWSHMWCCYRSQFDPSICQFCTKLQIKDKKINTFITKKLNIDSRSLFPADIFYTVTRNRDVPFFVHVNFGPDKQRPYSKHNYGAFHYEVINSPFMILKFYLDVLGIIILNQCDEYLLPELFENEDKKECRNHTICLP